MKDIFPPLVEWGMEKGFKIMCILAVLYDGIEYEREAIRHEVLRRFDTKISSSGVLLLLNLLRAIGYIERRNLGRYKPYKITDKGKKAFERGLNHLKSLVKRLEKRMS